MTSEELDTLEMLWLRKTPVRKIASQMSYSVSGINYQLMKDRDRFPPRRPRRVDRNCAELLASRVCAGHISTKQMAFQMGVSYETARRWVRMYEAKLAEGQREA